MVKTLVKSVLGRAAPRMPAVQHALDRGLTVLMFHDVTDSPAPFSRENGLTVGVNRFRRQAEFLAETFRIISIDELLAGQIPPRAALLTFDDGFAGVFRSALPILQALRITSTVFLNMATVSGEPCWGALVVYLCRHVAGFRAFLLERCGEAARVDPHMTCSPSLIREWDDQKGLAYREAVRSYAGSFATREDLETVRGDPLVAFGSHSFHHYSFRALSDAEAEADIRANAEALASYPNDRPIFAFPFGVPGRSFSARQVERVLGHGYRRVFTVLSRVNAEVGATVLHRLALTDWHDRRSRFWYQVGRAALEGRQ